MPPITKLDPDRAFIQQDTPTFAEIVARIAPDDSLSPTRRRDMISGLRRISKALGRDPGDVPADSRWLQPRLGKITPAAQGLSKKAWQNALSDARSALVHCGIVEARGRAAHINDLDPCWHRLWRMVLDANDKTLAPALCRFVHFLNQLGVAPDEVGQEHHLGFLEALRVNEISKSPETAHRAAVNGWNLAVKRLPEWPRQTLTVEDRRKIVRLPRETYPPGFGADLDRFLNNLAAPDPFSVEGPMTPRSPATINQYRAMIERFAGYTVAAGIDPNSMSSLAKLTEPETVKTGLRHMMAQNEGKSSIGIDETAALLALVGRRHVRHPAPVQAELDHISSRVAVPRNKGLTQKNRERLSVLRNPAIQRKLLNLPATLIRRSQTCDKPYTAALMREDAVALAILFFCPIRRKNLVTLDLGQHLHRPGDGRVFLRFEDAEVKNGQSIEFELPGEVAIMIDRHVAKRSPTLCPPGTPWLFPRRDGTGPMDLSTMGSRLTKRLRAEIGIDMNLHLFRHFGAMLYLEAHPGQYEVVRRLLGHKELSQTLNAYVGFEAGTATRLFADTVMAARR